MGDHEGGRSRPRRVPRNAIRYAQARQMRRRDNADHDLEGECLTLITNAVLC